MDDPKLIFKYKYEKLRELLKGGPEAQILDIAAILRHLLVDKQTLVDVVNQEYRLPIRFKVFRSASESAEQSKMPGETSTFVFTGTVWPPFAPLKEIKKDEFLDFDLLYLDGTRFTVKQIVKFCANQLGGIHFERNSSDPDDYILRKLNNAFRIAGASTALSSLLLIGKTTIQALEELYNQVLVSINK
jgi:hypothetical protein